MVATSFSFPHLNLRISKDNGRKRKDIANSPAQHWKVLDLRDHGYGWDTPKILKNFGVAMHTSQIDLILVVNSK